MSDHNLHAAVEALCEPQWRTVPVADLPDDVVGAFVMGRNWMVDRLRALLAEHPAEPPSEAPSAFYADHEADMQDPEYRAAYRAAQELVRPDLARANERADRWMERYDKLRAAVSGGYASAQEPPNDTHHEPGPLCDEECQPGLSDVTAARLLGAERALREAALAARGMHDPVAPDCAEWADWLDARAARFHITRRDTGGQG